MTLTIAEMTAEIRDNNIQKGHRPPEGGPGPNTLGDYTALLLTEIAEATEAYRDHRLTDATDYERFNAAGLSKPEGVGSELADILIRLLDTVDVFGFTLFNPDLRLVHVADLQPHLSDPVLPKLITFGDHMAWLSRRVDRMWTNPYAARFVLRCLITIARKYGFDLDAEYARKHAYNKTRPHQHGGRALAETGI